MAKSHLRPVLTHGRHSGLASLHFLCLILQLGVRSSARGFGEIAVILASLAARLNSGCALSAPADFHWLVHCPDNILDVESTNVGDNGQLSRAVKAL